MLDRLRLTELAEMNFYFCRNYQSTVDEYADFKKEYELAQKHKNKSTQ
jgi:hypothetical protein